MKTYFGEAFRGLERVKLSVIFFLILFPFGEVAWGWGDRGHHTICFVATRLVKDPVLAEFLLSRGNLMGEICNVPDSQWKEKGGVAKVGDSSHFLDHEVLGDSIQEVPSKWSETVKKLSEKRGKPMTDAEVLKDLGGLWWRAAQFLDGAQSAFRQLKAEPQSSSRRSKPLQDAVIQMGLAGHFVGDATMPYHLSLDYDGWGSGRGGIHAYYEIESLNALGMDLDQKVFESAQKMNCPGVEGDGVPDRMKAISVVTYLERSKLEELDPLIRPSTGVRKGPSAKPAVRSDRKTGAKRFESLIILQLSRSARCLADFWDDLYRKSGSPIFSGEHRTRFVVDVPFVYPKY